MKKILFLSLSLTALLISCSADINQKMYDKTVGKDNEKTPPGNITSLHAQPATKSVILNWANPADDDFYGVTLSINPAAGSLAIPVTYKNKDKSQIPTRMVVSGLSGGTDYTFTITTFDYNNNESSGVSVAAAAEGENTGSTENFSGDNSIFAYKKDLVAYDFGYCTGATQRVIQLNCKQQITLTGTTISAANKMGTGSFVLNSNTTGMVDVGGVASFTVTYTPGSNSWDEADLCIGGEAGNNKIRLIGSGFKQPNDISKKEGNKNFGLRMWLRTDMITSSDLVGSRATRIPDYSGNGFHAYNTDTGATFAPVYSENDPTMNNMTSLDFNTDDNSRKGQFLCISSGADPIINSSKGSTTFLVISGPENPNTITQSLISSNYGQSFPSLVHTYRYYDETYGTSTTYHNGWGVKGSGLYGNYRYVCKNNNLNDNNNTFDDTDYNNTKMYISMKFDQDSLKGQRQPRAGGNGYNYPSNIFLSINGQERLLSYIYSNATPVSQQPLGRTYDKNSTVTTAYCYGAYGKPMGDGLGHRYGDLKQIQTPSADHIQRYYGIGNKANTEEATKVYEQWLANRNKPTDRAYDWAYTYTPYDYIDQNGTFKASTLGKSYASSESGCPWGAYFNNWISTEDRRNGTIYSVIIGTDNVLGTVYRGKVSEVIMFDYPLDDTEMKIVNNYIHYRYGIGSAQ